MTSRMIRLVAFALAILAIHTTAPADAFVATTSSVAITSTTAETAVACRTASGSEFFIASDLGTGAQVRILGSGIYSTGESTGSLTLRVKAGDTTVTESAPFYVEAEQTDQPFRFDSLICIREGGASGVAIGTGEAAYEGTATTVTVSVCPPVLTALDTSEGKSFKVTAQWSEEDPTHAITFDSLVIENSP